jgi:hypothetical protein
MKRIQESLLFLVINEGYLVKDKFYG